MLVLKDFIRRVLNKVSKRQYRTFTSENLESLKFPTANFTVRIVRGNMPIPSDDPNSEVSAQQHT